MTRSTKVVLLLAIVAILAAGHLLERRFSSRHGRRSDELAVVDMLLSPFRDASLPEVPSTAPDGGSVPREPRLYVVQQGDVLGKIAKRTLGSTAGWEAILRLNHDVLAGPGSLRPGMRLMIPGPGWRDWLRRRGGAAPSRRGTSATADPGPDPPGTYTVRRGDTLGAIAQRTLGSVRYANALYEANRTVIADPDRLVVGTRLRVPARRR